MHPHAPVGFDPDDLDEAADVVVVNYNGRDQLATSLPVWDEFRAAGYISDIIVVDNASGDGSVQFLRREYPSAVLVENDENLGWGVAVNHGFDAASADQVFVATPDMIPTESWCHTLQTYLDANEQVGLATGIVMRPSGRVDSRGAIANGLFRFDTAPSSDEIQAVDAGRGSALLVRRDAFESVNGIDSDLFIQGGDINLSLKLKEGGWHLSFVPGALVWHCEPLSPGTSLPYYNTRNLYLLAARHLSTADFLRVVALNACLHLVGSTVQFLLGRRSGAELSSVWRGVSEGFRLAAVERFRAED